MRSRCLIAATAILPLFSAVLQSQTLAEFEVASIRRSNLQGPRVNAGFQVDGAQVRYTLVPLISYISYAYDVRTYQIVGPDWLRSQYFDIAAKLPEGASTKQVPQALRALLSDRFGLRVHQETRDFPVYALEVAKGGLRMTELPSDPASQVDSTGALKTTVSADSTGAAFSLGGGAYFIVNDKGAEAKKLSMMALAYMLTPFLDRPIVDMTGLKGSYDFTLNILPEEMAAMSVRSAVNAGVPLPPQALRVLDNASNDSLMRALQKLGLTLVSRKVPLHVIVIDTMEKNPTEN